MNTAIEIFLILGFITVGFGIGLYCGSREARKEYRELIEEQQFIIRSLQNRL